MLDQNAIRLVAVDIDGTLVDDDKNIPPVNLKALHLAHARGVQIAIASGRMVSSIMMMERRLGLDCAIIAYNGGKVVGTQEEGRPTISHRPLPVEVAEKLLEFATSERHPLNFYCHDKLYCDAAFKDSPLTKLYTERTGSVYQFTDVERFRRNDPTKLILLAEPAERNRLYQEFSRRLQGIVNVVCTEPEYLEFMALGVDKATAIPELADYLGIEVRQILAIGDADNDRQMLIAAGVGVAVANAHEGVLESAPFRTQRTNNEGAVAEAVERWVLGPSPALWGNSGRSG